jgi:hypothetical protein
MTAQGGRSKWGGSSAGTSNVGSAMLLFAHAGHVLTSLAYFVPVVAFLVWLLVTQIRERRGRSRR